MVTPAVDAVETFRIAVDDAVLSDLRDRLKRTRLPDQIEGTGWEYGIPIDYLALVGRILAGHATTGGVRKRG